MKNIDVLVNKYTKEEFLYSVPNEGKMCVLKNSMEFSNCDYTQCTDCALYVEKTYYCKVFQDWLEEEYEEVPIDWVEVPIDTMIEVSNDGFVWTKGFFAGYIFGQAHTFCDGRTSLDYSTIVCWEYARLIKE